MSSLLYRTYSSPNLRRRPDSANEENQLFFIIGDRVYLDRFRAASVAYFGEVEFSSGDWVGLVLDSPTGNHDGRVHGRRYFQCDPMHGVFARPSRVTRMSSFDEDDHNWPSTPLPSSNEMFDAVSDRASEILAGRGSRASSGLGASYIYDEDYRNSPNVFTLEERLRQMGRGGSTLPRQSILKRPASSRPSSRADEILERLERATAHTTTGSENRNKSPSVFEFRPKRTQLEEYENYQDRVRRYKSSNDLSTEPLRLNDRVSIRTGRGEENAILRFMGETKFATGEWAGVELEAPNGRNDGSVLGHRYFYCPQNYGLFVPITRVKRRSFGNIRNTLKSPPYSNLTTGRRDDYLYSSFEDRPFSASSLASSPAYSNTYSPTPNKYALNNTLDMYNSHDWLAPRSNLTGTPQPAGYLTTSYTTTPPKTKETKGQAKSVIYTFTSSKYDGNPVAHRTLSYN